MASEGQSGAASAGEWLTPSAAAERPEAPDRYALHYATDTGDVSAYSGGAWRVVGRRAAPEVEARVTIELARPWPMLSADAAVAEALRRRLVAGRDALPSVEMGADLSRFLAGDAIGSAVVAARAQGRASTPSLPRRRVLELLARRRWQRRILADLDASKRPPVAVAELRARLLGSADARPGFRSYAGTVTRERPAA